MSEAKHPACKQRRKAVRYVVDRSPGAATAATQITEHVLDLVALGQLGAVLEPGDKLPTVAQLERELGVSHGTIVRANQDLEKMGIARGRNKGGTTIVDMPNDVRDAVITGFAGRRIRKALLDIARLGVGRDLVERAWDEQVKCVYGELAGEAPASPPRPPAKAVRKR